jgi:type I restriction enzyme S subunit
MAEFVYFSAVRAVNILQSMSHGSVFSTITRKTFDGLDIVYPPDNVLEEFARQSGLMLERTLEAQRESRTLAALRDSLLPRLMSGQLRIRDAEKQVEEVV